MRDPLEGVCADGTIRTGVERVRVPASFEPVITDAVDGWAADVAARLSHRYVELCRGVEIGTARSSDFAGSGVESYGNRVFLRHYCVSLAGPDAVRPSASFAADARAARGFNGDIRRCLARWRVAGSPARSIARKTLVTAAGIVSIRTGGWTTDRAAAIVQSIADRFADEVGLWT